MKRWLSATPILLVGVACNFGASPSETVDRLVEAIKAKDSVEVARYIDIRRVSEAAVDPLIQAANLMSQTNPDAIPGQAGALNFGMLEQFRPMIAPLMEQVLWQMMLDPEGLKQGPMGMMLGNQPLPFDELGSAYQGVLEERTDGTESIVAIELLNEDSGRPPLVFEMRLAQVHGEWQVIAFENLTDIIAEGFGGR
jgi:hypothetical protein